MHSIVLFVHLTIAFLIIVLVLIQQGKGADAGASFGSGGSQTMFGSQGAGNFLSHTTAVLATVFFVTSFGLALITKKEAAIVAPTLPSTTQEVPVSPPATDKSDTQSPVGVPVPMPAPAGSYNEGSNTAPNTDADVPVKK